VASTHRPKLASAIAESSLLAGRIEFFDIREPDAAQASLVVALQAAHDGDDVLLAAAVLAHMAFIPGFSGDSRRVDEARDKLRAARTFARRGPAPAELFAWINAVEAEVETLLGDTRHALRLIRDAEEILSVDEQEKPSPPWLDWFSQERLAGFKGNTLLKDGQLGLARRTLQDVLDSPTDTDVKQRAVTLADLAAIEALSESPEKACELTIRALDNLGSYWYATGMERVRTVRQMLSKWEGMACVRELDDKLYDWNTTVSSLSD